MNSLLFPFAQHDEGSSHEWLSFSRLDRCYRLCGTLAFPWLCQVPLIESVSEWMNMTSASPNKAQLGTLRVGFVPLIDSAPLIMAKELGLFARHGLSVHLSRELGWATIRDKIIYGELDAAHAPAALPFAANCGLGSDQCACVSGLVLNLQGNAITLSRELWGRGVRDAATLGVEIRRSRGRKTFTFGVVFSYSSHHFLLRQWLKSGAINPDLDVRIVVVPPGQMFPNLKLGYLDGYCVGEPWTSVAVRAGVGVCVATSPDLAPLHPEKVLMVRRAFAEERAEEHERLIAALMEACAFCDQPENRLRVSECLARPHYVNAPADCVRAGLAGPFDFGDGRVPAFLDLNIFNRNNANEPTDEKAAWVMECLYELLQSGAVTMHSLGRTPVLKNVFRRDVFKRVQLAIQNRHDRMQHNTNAYETQSIKEAISVTP
jgi:ABC-type nitrate/sulfonate/bicarbonate transport system substrate-binding protein